MLPVTFLSRGIGKNLNQSCMINEKHQFLLKAINVMKVPE